MERMSVIDYSEELYRGHVVRYMIANSFVRPGETVLDAACGTGYSQHLLANAGEWVGVDKDNALEFPLLDTSSFVQADLDSWNPDFSFDVFVSFETVEHIKNFKQLLKVGKQAERMMILSVPVVPSSHYNEFHLHDFRPGQLPALIENKTWGLYQTLYQPSEFAEIYVFVKRGDNPLNLESV